MDSSSTQARSRTDTQEQSKAVRPRTGVSVASSTGTLAWNDRLRQQQKSKGVFQMVLKAKERLSAAFTPGEVRPNICQEERGAQPPSPAAGSDLQTAPGSVPVSSDREMQLSRSSSPATELSGSEHKESSTTLDPVLEPLCGRGLSKNSTSEGSRSHGSVDSNLEDDSWLIQRQDIELCRRPDGSLHLLGSGGFGSVYKAVKDGVSPVAVKVTLRSSTTLQQADSEVSPEHSSLRDEFEILKKCRHPQIVQFLGAVLDGREMMLVTELCEGGDLHAALRSRSATGTFNWYKRPLTADAPPTPGLGKQIALDVASGMNFLHSHNIVHLDLKSPNVLLGRNHTAKIADVGMARILNDKAYLSRLDCPGTFSWSAPELLMGMRCTEKVDIYSFGILLWEIVTGEAPVRGIQRPVRVSQECPQLVAELIARCCAPEPEERPSARDIVRTLSAADPEASLGSRSFKGRSLRRAASSMALGAGEREFVELLLSWEQLTVGAARKVTYEDARALSLEKFCRVYRLWLGEVQQCLQEGGVADPDSGAGRRLAELVEAARRCLQRMSEPGAPLGGQAILKRFRCVNLEMACGDVAADQTTPLPGGLSGRPIMGRMQSSSRAALMSASSLEDSAGQFGAGIKHSHPSGLQMLPMDYNWRPIYRSMKLTHEQKIKIVQAWSAKNEAQQKLVAERQGLGAALQALPEGLGAASSVGTQDAWERINTNMAAEATVLKVFYNAFFNEILAPATEAALRVAAWPYAPDAISIAGLIAAELEGRAALPALPKSPEAPGTPKLQEAAAPDVRLLQSALIKVKAVMQGPSASASSYAISDLSFRAHCRWYEEWVAETGRCLRVSDVAEAGSAAHARLLQLVAALRNMLTLMAKSPSQRTLLSCLRTCNIEQGARQAEEQSSTVAAQQLRQNLQGKHTQPEPHLQHNVRLVYETLQLNTQQKRDLVHAKQAHEERMGRISAERERLMKVLQDFASGDATFKPAGSLRAHEAAEQLTTNLQQSNDELEAFYSAVFGDILGHVGEAISRVAAWPFHPSPSALAGPAAAELAALAEKPATPLRSATSMRLRRQQTQPSLMKFLEAFHDLEALVAPGSTPSWDNSYEGSCRAYRAWMRALGGCLQEPLVEQPGSTAHERLLGLVRGGRRLRAVMVDSEEQRWLLQRMRSSNLALGCDDDREDLWVPRSAAAGGGEAGPAVEEVEWDREAPDSRDWLRVMRALRLSPQQKGNLHRQRAIKENRLQKIAEQRRQCSEAMRSSLRGSGGVDQEAAQAFNAFTAQEAQVLRDFHDSFFREVLGDIGEARACVAAWPFAPQPDAITTLACTVPPSRHISSGSVPDPAPHPAYQPTRSAAAMLEEGWNPERAKSI